jgi:hypothetical protein
VCFLIELIERSTGRCNASFVGYRSQRKPCGPAQPCAPANCPPPLIPGNLLLVMCVVLAVSVLSASFAVFLVRERASGSKAVQLIAGASPSAFWAANLAFDVAYYSVSACMGGVCAKVLREGRAASGEAGRWGWWYRWFAAWHCYQPS